MDPQLVRFDPRGVRPSYSALATVQEVINRLEDVFRDSSFPGATRQLAQSRIEMLNDWYTVAIGHLQSCTDALNGKEVIDFLTQYRKSREQSVNGVFTQTQRPMNLPCQRDSNDPTTVAMSKCLHDPTANVYYKYYKKVKKTLYGEVRYAIVCTPGDNGVLQHTHERVAVKIFEQNATVNRVGRQGDRLLENGIQEIIAQHYLATPGHPHVQQCRSCLFDDQRIFVVQDKANSSLLDDLLRRTVSGDLAQNHYTIHRIRNLFHQIVLATQYLHNSGIAHRDISLENVLIYPNDHIRIIDLGLCAPMLLTATDGPDADWAPIPYQGPVGKLRYMAPEVYSASREIKDSGFYDACAADIWSLGCCLYTLLLDRQPYDHPDLTCELYKHMVVHGVTHQGVKDQVVSCSGSLAPPDIDMCYRAVALLQRMLDIEPKTRISLSDILADPFFAS